MMLKDISVSCEDGLIKLFWEWDHNDLDGLIITYKKSEIKEGKGTEFVKGKVMRRPHSKTGKAERRLVNEDGFYTFTFIPIMRNGSQDKQIILPDILLGKKRVIYWRLDKEKENILLSFSGLPDSIPAGVIRIIYAGSLYKVDYEIDGSTRLLFPDETGLNHMTLQAAEPYNKLYQFIKQS